MQARVRYRARLLPAPRNRPSFSSIDDNIGRRASDAVAVEVGQNRIEPAAHVTTVEKMLGAQGAHQGILHQIICGLGIARERRE